MAELHESILVSFRKKFLRSGFTETKSPMPTFRPDVFATRISKNGYVVEEIVVEAEVKSTLFTNHTSEQLVIMNDYIKHRIKKRIRVRGFLVIPKGKQTIRLAISLLSSLDISSVKILQF